MFSKAYSIATQFTFPVVVCTKDYNNHIKHTQASFIVLNSSGYILAAAHTFRPIAMQRKNADLIKEYNLQVKLIELTSGISSKQKRDRIKKIPFDSEWIKASSCTFGWGKLGNPEFKVVALDEELDLLVGLLEPFNPEAVAVYPTIKNPKNTPIATGLCKIGFPMHFKNVEDIIYNEETNKFKLKLGPYPNAYPIEGIFTREEVHLHPKSGEEFRYIETSNVGFEGISGGPIVDVNGVVWSIYLFHRKYTIPFLDQSKKEDHKYVTSFGPHPRTIVEFLKKNSISFDLSD